MYVEMSCKTALNSNPRGKPRVYFTCHPSDFDRCFEAVTDGILKHSDCAIYYYKPDGEPRLDDDYFARLSEMNLFVMPVSARLLDGGSRAIDVDFEFAMKMHIPVLPLMQEPGLEVKFNARCGELQFLDPYTSDVTAISYDEKLKKYLDAILIGDSLANRVRGEFDAYIFLSYRKKDRAHAQRLMRLIHRTRKCRDVAIWYDEFLTPGENFNTSIADALDKSRLFALAVTPSLLERSVDGSGSECENYIVTTEYPMAVSAGKPVLPAELVPTDKDVLNEKYPGIPECIDANDEDALAGALVSHIGELAREENDGDPEHNYYIGLAYLTGVDVEINHELAVELITSAAEAGVRDAMEKLAEMYRDGEGVAIDREKHIYWRAEMAERARKIYEERGRVGDAIEYFVCLGELGDAYHSLSRLSEARECYQRALELTKLMLEQSGTDNDRSAVAVCYLKLGEIYEELGDKSGAEELYVSACETFERLAESGDNDIKRYLLISYARLSEVGSLRLARKYAFKACELAEKVARENSSADALRDVVTAYTNLGRLLSGDGNLSQAEGYLLKALDIAERVAREADTPNDYRTLSVVYERLADLYKEQHRLGEAADYYEKSLTISRRLADEDSTPGSQYDLSVCYHRLGDIRAEMGDIEGAGEYYSKALEIREALVRESEVALFTLGLATLSVSIGKLMRASGDPATAKSYFRKALTLAEGREGAGVASDNLRLAAICCSALGELTLESGEVSEAVSYHTRALSLIDEISRLDGMSEYERTNALFIGHYRLFQVCRASNDTEGAISNLLIATENCERLVEGEGAISHYRDLSHCYTKLGDLYEAEGKTKEARIYFVKSLKNSERSVEVIGDSEVYDDLALSCYNLGCLDKDPSLLKRAYDIWQMLVRKYPDESDFAYRRDVAASELAKLGGDLPRRRGLLSGLIDFIRKIFKKR